MEMPQFVEARGPRWRALEELLDKADARGLQSLSLEEARQLSRLYRAASSDLLFVRARSAPAEVTGYLNDVVGRAYALTYPGKRPRLADAWGFVARGFPDVFRREVRMFLASMLFFLAGMGFGYLGMLMDRDAAPYLVPAEHLTLDPTERAKHEATEAGATVEEQAAFTSFLFTHNIQVAFLAFALGLTAGVGTAVMLFVNGLMLGALAHVYAAKGLAGWFWAWILPHGIPEVTAICIAGAAGLVIARGLVAPGGLSRRQALRKEGLTSVRLLMGTLLLFVLAGCIEGTISQIHPPRLSVAFKVGFALLFGGGVYTYLFSSWLRAPSPATIPRTSAPASFAPSSAATSRL